MTEVIRLTDELMVLADHGVNAGLLQKDGRGFLIDCHRGCTRDLIRSLGVAELTGILLTQHRRDLIDGLSSWLEERVPVYCSAAVADILEKAGDRWTDPDFRWRRFARMTPDLAMPIENVAVTFRVSPGDTLNTNGLLLHIIDAEGSCPGALAGLVESGHSRFLFSSTAAMAGGKLRDLWTLQKGFGQITDYHGILGAAPELQRTWQRFKAAQPDLLVPAFGPLEKDPSVCLERLRNRLTGLQKNIVYASALNHYFPDLYQSWQADWPRFPKAETLPLPPFIRRLEGPAFLLVSQDGYAFLIDCGLPQIAEILHQEIQSGLIKGLEGVWISHMHYDHTEGLACLATLFDCPVYASRLTADTLCHPDRYFIPCQYPEPFAVTGLADQTVFTWRGFTLTAFEFPGQTLYHGGLLVEGQGRRVLFAGDSFSATGLDDYCPQNRVLPGPGRGMRLCLDRIRSYQPDCLINQHQTQAFRFSEDQWQALKKNLLERELLTEQITGQAAGWAWDDAWCRVVPFEQTAAPGSLVQVTVEMTNHDQVPRLFRLDPLVPAGLQLLDDKIQTAVVPALTSGSSLSPYNPDYCLSWQFRLQDSLNDGETLALLFRENGQPQREMTAVGLIHIRC